MNTYTIGQTVTIPGTSSRATIEAERQEGESRMLFIAGEWYSLEAVESHRQAIISAYYSRNAWARPGASYEGRSIATGHFTGGARGER